MNRNDVDAEEEVLPESLAVDHLLEILVGGRDNPNIHGYGSMVPNPLELFCFKDSEELHLCGQGDVRNLIKEEVSFVSCLEPADSMTISSCEGAFDVAEELALEQGFIERCAVELDKRRVFSPAHEMNGPCHQFFPGTAFSIDDDRRIAQSSLLNDLIDSLHRRGAPDNPLKAVLRLKPVGKKVHFLIQPL